MKHGVDLSGVSGSSGQVEDSFYAVSDGINACLLKEFDGELYAAFSYVRCTNEALQHNLAALFDELMNSPCSKLRGIRSVRYASPMKRKLYSFGSSLLPAAENSNIESERRAVDLATANPNLQFKAL
jgi:hypothetical protein